MRVYLPSVLCGEAQTTSGPVAVPSEGTGHVLIIDDEKEVAEAAQAILEFLGYTTTICLGGREAVTFYRQATDIYVELGNLRYEGVTRNNIADTLCKL